MPLGKADDNFGHVPEAHLLNFFDEVGDEPEYETYSKAASGYDPLIEM